MPMRLLYRCRVIFAGCPKQIMVERDTSVTAVLALWKSTIRPESDPSELDDQDRFFPISEPPNDWETDPVGFCIPVLRRDLFEFRFIHKREMVQSLLTEEEGDLLWHDQFDLVPLRANVMQDMFLTLHSWTHTRLSMAAPLEEMKEVNCLRHWDHRKDFHSISGTGTLAGCQLWATIWEPSLTNEGRASFHLEVNCDSAEATFNVTERLCKPTAARTIPALVGY